MFSLISSLLPSQISSITLLSVFLIACLACGDDLAGRDAYFGAPLSAQSVGGTQCVEGGAHAEAGTMGGAVSTGGEAGIEPGTAGASAGVGGEPMCSPRLTPSGADRSGAVAGCEEGCADLARCAIIEGECPGLTSCDDAGVVDACMEICSEQLLAVFSTLSGCADVIGLAKSGLGEPFASACVGE